MKSSCAFLCDDVLGRNCILDVFAGGVLLRLLARASTFSMTLSRGDCLPQRKAFSGMRGCMSIGVIVGHCTATSFPVCGLDCSNAGERENTGGDIVISRHAGPDKVIGLFLFVGIDAVVRPTASIGVKTLGVAGKKLRQSS